MGNPPRNPWLEVPASDYEAHMDSPQVRQLAFLGEVFRRVLVEFRPKSLAVLGCATGNGFEHIDPAVTTRVVGIDINPSYLRVLKSRFGDDIAGLELLASDVAVCPLEPGSLDLVHCALIFEYLYPAVVLDKVALWLGSGGVMCSVLQLPSDSGDVTETKFSSLRRLKRIMSLVEPRRLAALAEERRLHEIRSWTETPPTGKAFSIGLFRLRDDLSNGERSGGAED